MDISLLNFITLEHGIKKDTVILPPFKIPLGKTPPKKRFVSVYGTKATSTALSDARRQALKNKLSLYRVDLTIDGGDLPRGKISLNDLANIKFLNLERITKDLASTMMTILFQNGDPPEFKNPLKILAEEPNRFDYLWKDSRFAHITTFSWNAPATLSKPHKILKLAVTQDVKLFNSVDVRNYKKEEGALKIQFAV